MGNQSHIEKLDTTEHDVKTSITVNKVSKTFYINDNRPDTLRGALFSLFQSRNSQRALIAVNNVSFDLVSGETFGIIGRNGSGKSTLVKLMSGAFVPDKGGSIVRNGTSMLLNLGVGMSHELTARQNIYVSGSALGLKIRQIDQIFDEIIAFAELEDFVDSKIKYFSSGMIQRLSFSIAVNAGADIMFLDEVFAVGDAKFRKKAVAVMEKSWLEKRTIVMVSHSLSNIKKYCDRVLYMKKGEAAYIGDPATAIKMYNEDNKD